jgi:hypothetical protein
VRESILHPVISRIRPDRKPQMRCKPILGAVSFFRLIDQRIATHPAPFRDRPKWIVSLFRT